MTESTHVIVLDLDPMDDQVTRVVGPFPTDEEAVRYASKHLEPGSWCYATLEAPPPKPEPLSYDQRTLLARARDRAVATGKVGTASAIQAALDQDDAVRADQPREGS